MTKIVPEEEHEITSGTVRMLGVVVIVAAAVWFGAFCYQNNQKQGEIANCSKLQQRLDRYPDFFISPDQADQCYQLGVPMFNERVK